MTPPRTVWVGRDDLADYATALGVEPSLVLAVVDGPSGILAFYTPHYDDGDETMWLATLARKLDAGGLVVVDTEPRPDLWDRIRAGLDPLADDT